jgi:ATP-dependent DNA ligase
MLDGEVAVLDPSLISRFEWLRGRPKSETATPAIYMVFDCLCARGKDVRKRPLRIRWHLLEDEVDGHRLITRLVELQLRAQQERAQRR